MIISKKYVIFFSVFIMICVFCATKYKHSKILFLPKLVEPYSVELEHHPFDGPYLLHFQKNGFNLYYVCSYHSNYAISETFLLINRVFERFKIKAAIIEGLQNNYGENPMGYIEDIKGSDGNFYKWGEPAFTAELALKHHMPFIGIEPSDQYIWEQVKKSGYSLDDFLGYYFLRMIPQYQRQNELSEQSLKRHFTEFFTNFDPNIMGKYQFSYEDLLTWYKQKNNKSFDPMSISSQESAPIANGMFTQRIASIIDFERDKFFIEVISRQLNKYKSVIVVLGKSHFVCEQKAIERAMGKAVYQGTLH